MLAQHQIICDLLRSQKELVASRSSTSTLVAALLGTGRFLCPDSARLVAEYALQGTVSVDTRAIPNAAATLDPARVFSHGLGGPLAPNDFPCVSPHEIANGILFREHGRLYVSHFATTRAVLPGATKHLPDRLSLGQYFDLDPCNYLVLLTDAAELRAVHLSEQGESTLVVLVDLRTACRLSTALLETYGKAAIFSVDRNRWLCVDSSHQRSRFRVFADGGVPVGTPWFARRCTPRMCAVLVGRRVAVARGDNTLTTYDLASGRIVDVRQACPWCALNFNIMSDATVIADRLTGVLYTSCGNHSWSVHF